MDYYIKPITTDDIDGISDKCWDDREHMRRLFERQEILGFGAWEEGRSVGVLHCYAVSLPDWDNSNFPWYAKNRLEDWPLGWPLIAAREKRMDFGGMVWGHGCFHVGLLKGGNDPDPFYLGRGIGYSLLKASVAWAKEKGYKAVVGHGGPKSVPAYNTTMGCLPYTAYVKEGFESAALEEEGKRFPWWTTTENGPWSGHTELKRQVSEAVKAYGISEVCARLMVLRL